MRFTHLVLKNVRCFEEKVFAFGPKLNTLYGKNALGKTTLLEALYLLAVGRSFRTHNLSEMIRHGASFFYIEGHFEKNGVQQVLKVYYGLEKKSLWHNLTPLPSLSSLFGILHATSLAPEDLSLIHGGPKVRRQLLDIQIAQTSPLYLFHLRRFQGALKQRNALLKQRKVEGIEIWEEQMALSAAFLRRDRKELVSTLNAELALTPFEPLLLRYNFQCDEGYREALAKNRQKDLHYKTTSLGPHKDDLLFLLEGKEAKLFASEGQKRSCIAALKLAQWSVLAKKTQSMPLLFIDDLGVSFDRSRTELLLSFLKKGLGQLFVTSALPSETLLQQGHSFELVEESGNALAN